MARTPQDPYPIPTIQPNLIAGPPGPAGPMGPTGSPGSAGGNRSELINAIPNT